MRVALLTDGIWPYVLGGMQKHSYYICRYLARQGVKVDLYHYNNSAYAVDALEFFTAEERANITPYVINFPKGTAFPGHYIYKNYQYSRLIFEAMQPHLAQYDFIYAKGFTPWYLLKQKRSGKISCARVGVKFHGYEMFQRSPDFKTKLQHLLLLRAPVRQISRMADVVFSYGGKITDIIKQIGVAPERIVEMPSGVETEWLVSEIRPAHKPMRFLFLGRYERRKGVEELNTVLGKLVKEEGLKWEMHFIGPIPKEKQVPYTNCKYHGEIRDRDQLLTHLRSMDVLVCPSWSEGMPNVILEAMANGLAVISTDTGATRLLVDAKNGHLLPEVSIPGLETVMRDFLNKPAEEIEAMKQTSVSRIKTNFLWEGLIKNLLEKLNLK